MEMAFISIANNSYFYINKQVEPLQQSPAFIIKWYFIMVRMAGVTINITHFYCMDTIAVDRNKTNKQPQVFWTYLYYNVHLEYLRYLVDMECISNRSCYGIFSKQSADVPALVIIQNYKKEIRKGYRLYFVDYILALL